jgi:hypothetical protein
MRSMNDRDVLFFANENRDASLSLYFLTVHRHKLIPSIINENARSKTTVWNNMG